MYKKENLPVSCWIQPFRSFTGRRHIAVVRAIANLTTLPNPAVHLHVFILLGCEMNTNTIPRYFQ